MKAFAYVLAGTDTGAFPHLHTSLIKKSWNRGWIEFDGPSVNRHLCSWNMATHSYASVMCTYLSKAEPVCKTACIEIKTDPNDTFVQQQPQQQQQVWRVIQK